MGLPSADDIRDATCVACPGQSLALGAFDVAPRPGPDHPYDPAAGHRISAATGTPTCVHPFRVGLAPAPYASAAVPLPTGRLVALALIAGILDFIPTVGATIAGVIIGVVALSVSVEALVVFAM